MQKEVISGLLLPFLGTSLGAGCVFFMKCDLSRGVQRALTGFAAPDDSRLNMEPYYSCHGYIKEHGETCFSACGDRILVRCSVSFAA